MRKYFIFLIAVTMGFGAWILYKEISVKKSFAPTSHTIYELEELVYREPLNVEYQLEMARAQYQKFEESMKTDEESASRFLTAYMVACYESGKRYDIYKELKQRYQSILQHASMPNVPLDIFYKNAKPIFKLTRDNVNRIIEVRNLYESVWKLISTKGDQHPEVARAQSAVDNYIRMIYEVEFGIKKVMSPSEDSYFKFGTAFYNKWEQGMRSYGQILPKHHGLLNDFQLKGSIDTPPSWTADSQIKTGESLGRYRLPNGDEVVPGLRYFEDMADNTYSKDRTSLRASLSNEPTASNPPAHQTDRPSDVYRHFRQLQAQGQWSASYDMFKANSQRKMTEETKIFLRSMLPDEKSRRKLDMMDGRDLFAVMSQNSTQNPIEILSENVDGNNATLKIRNLKNDNYITTEVHLIRVDGIWKIIWR